MSDNLLIVESPNKIKKIKHYLGDGWQVEASIGHFCDPPKHDMGVAAPDYKPHYENDPKKSKVINNLKKAVQSCQAIYIGTDPDREGEAIGWHLERVLGLRQSNKPVYRASFKAINKTEIHKGIQSKGKIDYHLVAAQEARRVIDRLVGYSVSPILGHGLSAGRVQSVALRLIVERFKTIKSFIAVEHYDVLATITDTPEWTAKWYFKPLLSDKEKKIWCDREIAEQVAQTSQLKVLQIDRKKIYQKAPPAFETASLQQAASRVLGFDTAYTMQLAQLLYASGWISYMRTDNPNPDQVSLTELRQFLMDHQLTVSQKPNTWRCSKDAQEGHEAIRPVDLNKANLQDSECQGKNQSDQVRLYRLIYERFLASQMADAEYNQTQVLLQSDVKLTQGIAQFMASGRVLTKNRGWQGWLQSDSNDNDEASEDEISPLPESIETGKIYACQTKLQVKKTKPPVLFTEASLIKALKAKGIGRPSTYASIIQTLFRHQYVTSKKRKLEPTDIGIKVFERLMNIQFSFMDYHYTAQMETQLDAIAHQQKRYRDVVAHVHNDILSDLNGLTQEMKIPLKTKQEPEAIGSCQLCQEGKVIESDKLYRCDHCEVTLWKQSFGKRIGKTIALKLFNGESVYLEKLKSQKTKKPYNAHGQMVDGKLKLNFDQPDKASQANNNTTTVSDKIVGNCYCKPDAQIKANGKKAVCETCNQWMWLEQSGHVFSDSEIVSLFMSKTIYIEGYQAKKNPNRTFGVNTRLDTETGRVKMLFD